MINHPKFTLSHLLGLGLILICPIIYLTCSENQKQEINYQDLKKVENELFQNLYRIGLDAHYTPLQIEAEEIHTASNLSLHRFYNFNRIRNIFDNLPAFYNDLTVIREWGYEDDVFNIHYILDQTYGISISYNPQRKSIYIIIIPII